MKYDVCLNFGSGLRQPWIEYGQLPTATEVRIMFERIPTLLKLEVFEKESMALVGVWTAKMEVVFEEKKS
jgi:hypothetical protein